MKSSYSVIGLIISFLCLAIIAPDDSWAKVIIPGELEPSRAHIRFSPEAQAIIKTAIQAEKGHDWKTVAENYQDAIELYPQNLINASVLDSKSEANPEIIGTPLRLRNNDLYWGVRYFCQNALRNLPAEGRKAYNGMFGPVARHAFDNLVKNRLDINKLEQLAERYALTESGRQALAILMRWYLERGEFYQAVGYYRELKLNHPQDAQGLPERKMIDDALAGKALDSRSSRQANVDWQTYCGNNTRSKIMPVQSATGSQTRLTDGQAVPLTGKGHSFSWNSFFKLPGHVVNLSRRPLNNQDGYSPIMSQESIPYFPAVTNNLVYLPTGSGIYAFDLLESKDGQAPYDPQGHPVGEMKVKWKVEYDISGQGFQEERTINTVTLSADGKRLYAPLISSYEKPEQQLGLVVKYPFPRRLLFCFNTTTTKALWTTEKALGVKDSNNIFEDMIFPIAPAEEDGVLYMAGLRMPNQIDIPEHYLFAINALNGAVYFKTFIGSGILETNLFNNPSREPIVSAVTVDSDNIYYCSQMGIITAVDKYTGAIKWLKKYEEYPIPPTWPRYTPPHLPLRWINNPIIRIDNTSFAEKKGQILATAIDSPFLYLVSADTGEELWRWNADNAPLGNVRHLVGVKDGFLMVSGESGIICLNLNKGGEEKWKRDGNRITGKSAITDDRIYIPENYMVTEIELKTGKLVNKQTFQGKEDAQPSANLLIAGAFLIRTSIGQMNIYRIEDKKETTNEKAK